MGEFGSFSSPESRRPFPAEWCSQSGLMWLFFSPSSLFFTDCCMLLFFPRAVVCTLLSRCCELWIKKMLLHSVLRSVVTAGTLVQLTVGRSSLDSTERSSGGGAGWLLSLSALQAAVRALSAVPSRFGTRSRGLLEVALLLDVARLEV